MNSIHLYCEMDFYYPDFFKIELQNVLLIIDVSVLYNISVVEVITIMADRTNEIISMLIESNEYLAFKELGQDLKVSERTVRYETKKIDDLLTHLQLPRLQQKRGSGIKLQLDSEQKQKLKAETLERQKLENYFSPDERLIRLLFSILDRNTKTVLYEQVENLRISKSTMDEDMRKVRSYLSNYSLIAQSSSKNGIVIKGDEKYVRTMIYDIISKFVDFHKIIQVDDISLLTDIESTILNYLGKEKIRKIKNYYNDHFLQDKFHVNEFYINEIIFITVIWIKRLEDQNMIQNDSHFVKKMEIRSEEIKGFVYDVIKNYSIKDIPTQELKYIVFILNSFDPEASRNSVDWVNAQLLSLQLINSVERDLKVPFSKEGNLFEGLYQHMVGLLNRLRSHVVIYNPLTDTIKNNYSNIYDAVKKFKKRIEDVTHNQVSDNEIAYLTIYFSTACKQVEKQENLKYKLAVICNHGLATGQLLAASLEDKFNISVVAVLSSHDTHKLNTIDVDLVFKTVDVAIDRYPSLKISPLLKKSDILIIKKFLDQHKSLEKPEKDKMDATSFYFDILNAIKNNYKNINRNIVDDLEKVFQNNHLNINKKKVQPMLEDILNDNLIVLQQNSHDWKQAIRDVAHPLFVSDFINEKYIDAMIQSIIKYGPYIVIGPHIALAHARPEDGVNKLGVSVMTLKNPVNFGHKENDPVSIIFCLAAINDYSHINVMKSIVQLINDEVKVQELVKTADIREFKKILFSKEVIN